MPLSIATAAVLLVGLAAAAPTKAIWQPLPGTKWQTSLSQTCTTTEINNAKDVEVFSIDLFINSVDVISQLHAANKKVVCYFSGGSYEPGRPDSGRFTAADKGADLEGWPGEVWLQTSSANVRSIMTDRIALAAKNGCDAVDPDNVDGFNNNNGLGLTKASAIDYVNFLADTAAAQGLAISLKNAGDIIPDVINKIQFSINEQCHDYGECATFAAFIKAGKPVFNIEYPGSISGFTTAAAGDSHCNSAATNSDGFSTILKNMNLDWQVKFCPQNAGYTGGSSSSPAPAPAPAPAYSAPAYAPAPAPAPAPGTTTPAASKTTPAAAKTTSAAAKTSSTAAAATTSAAAALPAYGNTGSDDSSDDSSADSATPSTTTASPTSSTPSASSSSDKKNPWWRGIFEHHRNHKSGKHGSSTSVTGSASGSVSANGATYSASATTGSTDKSGSTDKDSEEDSDGDDDDAEDDEDDDEDGEWEVKKNDDCDEDEEKN